jgi:hypothetical protein
MLGPFEYIVEYGLVLCHEKVKFIQHQHANILVFGFLQKQTI